MIQEAKIQDHLLAPHTSAQDLKLCVCVRKRPLFQKEAKAGQIDVVSCANPKIVVHEPKIKVDGITKYIQDQSFEYDNTFNENETSEDVYEYSMKGLIPLIADGGVVTCFAYGQTGSGKTFTMQGITDAMVADLHKTVEEKFGPNEITFMVSFFEIYGGRSYDLFNKRKKLRILEDHD
jgi:kinesin family member 2/24